MPSVNSMKVAAVQFDVRLGDVAHNSRTIRAMTEDAVRQGAGLVVFPECALCGYCFPDLSSALPSAFPVACVATEQLAATCARLDCHVVFGMLERFEDRLYNSAVLMGPTGLIGVYRKTHLPFLGIDRFLAAGDGPFEVFNVGDLRIGLNICYDANFSEVARCLALLGADLIVLPTNWVVGPGSLCTVNHVLHARALEHKVYYLAANRVGSEGGFVFLGRSKIVAPDGETLAEAPSDGPAIIHASVTTANSRDKHVVRIAGLHESHRFLDRRPDLYGLLTKPLSSPRS
jgi:predicted amidohydrolase